MSRSRRLGRRRFLQSAASGAAAAAAGCGGARSPWRYFTAAEGETLAALCDQIIPPDQDPGATAAGVLDFIDRQMNRRFKEHQGTYRDGLAALDRIARRLHGSGFAKTPFEKQTEMLVAIEQGKLPPKDWNEHSPRAFFDMLVAHTMMGYYGNPRHGGNRDAVSWKMLGVPIPPVRGRLHYELPRLA